MEPAPRVEFINMATEFRKISDASNILAANMMIREQPPPDLGAQILAEVQAMNVKLTGIDNRLTCVENRLTRVETTLTDVDNRLTRVETTLADVKNRLTGVENGLDTLTTRFDASSVIPAFLFLLIN
ncbi:hypothetical protein RUND412_007401 [Rhizina undulata]